MSVQQDRLARLVYKEKQVSYIQCYGNTLALLSLIPAIPRLEEILSDVTAWGWCAELRLNEGWIYFYSFKYAYIFSLKWLNFFYDSHRNCIFTTYYNNCIMYNNYILSKVTCNL